MEIIEIIAQESGERIDALLARSEETLTRSAAQKLLDAGQVSVNGKAVRKNYKCQSGDTVRFSLPEPEETELVAQDIPLDVVFEDNDVIVVNKPKEMVVHPAAGHYSGTLVNALMYHLGDRLSGINGVMRPGIVHRIDRNTTGSLIVCKNDAAHNSIAEQLKVHSVNRKYHAICMGVLKEDTITIDKPIGRHPTDRKKMAVNEKNGKRAVTHVRVLKRFQGFTYIECSLETGRTHQIRVHLASIGHPLLGDDVYCDRKSPYKLTGQTLHAKTLGFLQPTSGEYVEVDAPLPDYFVHLLEVLPQ